MMNVNKLLYFYSFKQPKLNFSFPEVFCGMLF